MSQAQQAPSLTAEEEAFRYRSMFENALWGIFQTTAGGHYLTANPALARIYGYDSPAEMLAALTDIGSQLYVDPRRRDQFIRLMQDQGSVTAFESQVHRRDGAVIWISESCREVRNVRGELLYYEGSVEEITARKAAARELAEAKDQAEAASRAKSAFLANMSHELRTPLNAILGFAEILKAELYGPMGDARYRDYVADIHKSGGHLLEVINDILDIAKIEAGQFALVEDSLELNALFEECARWVTETARRRGIALDIAMPSPPLVLHADATRLKQILLNLLSNAVKFTPAGRVTLSAGLGEDGACLLEVTDTGIGMSAEEIAQALRPFQQIDNSLARYYEGTGLGLSLAKSLTELHGGRLHVDSRPGHGTTVTVRLPAWRVERGLGALQLDNESD